MPGQKRPAASPAWVGASNDRRRARWQAVNTMNDLAREAGAQPIPVKSTWRKVQKLIKTLEGRRLDGAATESLRACVQAWEDFGGKSSTMMYAYPSTLCHRAVVVTMDLSASNLECFNTHHWLSDERNVMALHLVAQAWE